ncbi:MAG: hypothetical protein NZ693_06395, partial [Thermoflexales bacterium]|nr:hypothetical protein [Thermoflexales bacterium]
CFGLDPADQASPVELYAWRLAEGRGYEAIVPDERGWVWSETLGAWLGVWAGVYGGVDNRWLRVYDRAGRLVPTFAEAERQRAEAERQRAEAERQRAEAERQRAEAERQRAEAAERRAEVAERERDVERQRLEQIKAHLRTLGIDLDL